MIITAPLRANPAILATGHDRLTLGYGETFAESAEETWHFFGALSSRGRVSRARAARYGHVAGMGNVGHEEWRRSGLLTREPEYLTEDAWKESPHYREDLNWQELSDPTGPGGERRVTARYAKFVNEAKREELRRRDALRRAPEGFGGGAAKFAGALAGSMLDPGNVALALIPVVGPATRAAMTARVGLTGSRIATGAASGAVGMALAEPLVYRAAKMEQADYTAMDSLRNVAYGTVFGAGLHAGGGAVVDAAKRMAPRLRGNGFRHAVNELNEGRIPQDMDYLVMTRAWQAEQLRRTGRRGSAEYTVDRFLRGVATEIPLRPPERIVPGRADPGAPGAPGAPAEWDAITDLLAKADAWHKERAAGGKGLARHEGQQAQREFQAAVADYLNRAKKAPEEGTGGARMRENVAEQRFDVQDFLEKVRAYHREQAARGKGRESAQDTRIFLEAAEEHQRRQILRMAEKWREEELARLTEEIHGIRVQAARLEPNRPELDFAASREADEFLNPEARAIREAPETGTDPARQRPETAPAAARRPDGQAARRADDAEDAAQWEADVAGLRERGALDEEDLLRLREVERFGDNAKAWAEAVRAVAKCLTGGS